MTGPGQEGEAVLVARIVLREPGTVERLGTQARRDRDTAELQDAQRLAPGVEVVEDLRGEDEPGRGPTLGAALRGELGDGIHRVARPGPLELEARDGERGLARDGQGQHGLAMPAPG